MSVTIKDVAALAGVSASTVSRTCKKQSFHQRRNKTQSKKCHEEARL